MIAELKLFVHCDSLPVLTHMRSPKRKMASVSLPLSFGALPRAVAVPAFCAAARSGKARLAAPTVASSIRYDDLAKPPPERAAASGAPQFPRRAGFASCSEAIPDAAATRCLARSEERRVGKEC